MRFPRRQLSLYVPAGAAAPIEAVRRLVDPVQQALIPAHVTLCRDEEAERFDMAALCARLAATPLEPLLLSFGAAEVFHEHGLRLPCIEGGAGFHALRASLVGAGRRLEPHITLAHPRNPRAAGNSPAVATGLANPLRLRFDRICLIEQDDRAQPWCVLGEAALGVPR